MAHWPSLPWSAVVKRNNRMTNCVDAVVTCASTNALEESSPRSLLSDQPGEKCRIVDLAFPWATIGSDSSCAICVNQPNVPAQAYIALSFDDWLEVWPINPGVYPKWDEDQNLIVGQSKIELTQSHPERMKKALEPTGLDYLHRVPGIDYSIRLLIESNGESQEVLLDRRVSILADKLPHSVRQRLGLGNCVHVVVLLNQRCWLIRTDRNSNCSSEHVQEAPVDGQAIKMGKVCFSAFLTSFTSLTTNSEAGEAEVRSGKNVARPHPAVCTLPMRIENGSINNQTDAGTCLDPTDQNARGIQVERTEPAPSEFDSTKPERVTMEVTSRLIARSQADWWRQNGIKIALTTALLLGSAAATSWIVMKHVLPIVNEKTSELELPIARRPTSTIGFAHE